MTFTNPIIGGTKLIRQAINSPDFQAGVSGWSINKDGTAEFNDAEIRGSLEAGGGNVTVNSFGVHVADPNVGVQFDVNSGAGFQGRKLPDNGSLSQLQAGGSLFLRPQTPSPVNGVVSTSGQVVAKYFTSGGVENPWFQIAAPAFSGKSGPIINMFAQASNDANPDESSHIDLFAYDINLFVDSSNPMNYARGRSGVQGVNVVAAASFTQAVVFTDPFPAGVTPLVFVNNDSALGNSNAFIVRARQATNTGFNIFGATTGAATSWNGNVQWMAFPQF